MLPLDVLGLCSLGFTELFAAGDTLVVAAGLWFGDRAVPAPPLRTCPGGSFMHVQAGTHAWIHTVPMRKYVQRSHLAFYC